MTAEVMWTMEGETARAVLRGYAVSVRPAGDGWQGFVEEASIGGVAADRETAQATLCHALARAPLRTPGTTPVVAMYPRPIPLEPSPLQEIDASPAPLLSAPPAVAPPVAVAPPAPPAVAPPTVAVAPPAPPAAAPPPAPPPVAAVVATMSSAPVRSITVLRNHAAGRVVVCCRTGRALQRYLPLPAGVAVIGTSAIAPQVAPLYTLVLGRPTETEVRTLRQLRGDERSVITPHVVDGLAVPQFRYRLGTTGASDFDVGNEGVLHCSRESAFVAAHLATWLGARCIVLAGVDFPADDPLAAELPTITEHYWRLRRWCSRRDIRLVSLSDTLGDCVPRVTWADIGVTP